jgi:CBS domain-containing protein
VSERLHASKRTRVADIQHLLGIEPVIVRADEDLLSAARRAIAHPQTRVIAVVDDQARLIGVIPALRLVEEVVARTSPEDLLAEVTDLASAGRFGRDVGARECREVMSPPIAVDADSSVADAFHAMKESRLSGLPVLDADRHVVGYLDVLELALSYLDAAPRPSAG